MAVDMALEEMMGKLGNNLIFSYYHVCMFSCFVVRFRI